MDQDATWYRELGLGPSDIVLDGDPVPLPQKGQSLQFSDYIHCGQTAGWIKMALCTQVGLGPGHILLDGDPTPAPQKMGHSPQFSAHVYILAKRLGGSRCHLVWR